jgi:MFS family permease
MINAVVACALALAVAVSAYREPEAAPAASPGERPHGAPAAPATSALADLIVAFSQVRLVVFLVCISGYYLLIEQFYQTFPVYIVRSFGEDAPREYITLINPAAIAVFGVLVGRLTKRISPLWAMAFGVLLAAGSMLAMGAMPTLAGACLSFLVFAVAEMILSPRYYEYVSSFAPRGREGLYMGLAIAPLGIGGLVGGVLSGQLITRYLPKGGPGAPLAVWGTYAAIGVGCSALLAVYAFFAGRGREPRAASEAA